MSDERLYDVVGREPMADDALEAAIAAYRVDHPDAHAVTLRLVGARLRRLNEEAQERAEVTKLATEAGTSEKAIRAARAERSAGDAVRRDEQELAAARRAVAPRGRGHGPEPIVSADEVRRVWAELGDAAGYGAVAKRLGVSESTIRRRLGKL